METLLEVDGLTKRFGSVLAVDDVAFSVPRGQVLGFLGPNGAGKSTTMKMITGFLAPSAGTARIAGYDIVDDAIAAKKHIGYLPEGAPAYGDMTPRSLLQFVSRVRGLDGSRRRERIDAVVGQLELGPVLEQPIETLSKGFKRRVGLAQAVLEDPDVLVLDEPTDGLDPNQKHEVRKLLRQMAGEKAIIISTHILEEVEAVCSRAIVISKGRIVADSEPLELLSRSRYHNAVSLRLRRDRTGFAIQRIEAVAGVATVERIEAEGSNETERIYALPESNVNILNGVYRALMDEQIEVEEISMVQGRLDDVFRELTRNA